MQYTAVHCIIVKCSTQYCYTVQYIAVQYNSAVHCSTLQCSAVSCCNPSFMESFLIKLGSTIEKEWGLFLLERLQRTTQSQKQVSFWRLPCSSVTTAPLSFWPESQLDLIYISICLSKCRKHSRLSFLEADRGTKTTSPDNRFTFVQPWLNQGSPMLHIGENN